MIKSILADKTLVVEKNPVETIPALDPISDP
jgi:hypothetical protein